MEAALLAHRSVVHPGSVVAERPYRDNAETTKWLLCFIADIGFISFPRRVARRRREVSDWQV